ncbi:MAG: hypothetical protein ABSD31_14480 [Candidatus Binataceae bacterium]
MGILETMGISGSPIEPLLEALSDLAGKNQALAERMNRHAERCVYAATKSAMERLAAKERAHAEALCAILAEYQRSAASAELPARDGTSNWERLTGDLALLSELGIELGRQAIHWESLDSDIARRIQAIADEDHHVMGELRKLALRADPQALD